MSAIIAALIQNLLPTIIALVGTLLGWLGLKLTKSIESKNKAEAAAAQIGQVALGLAGKIWDKLGPEIQNRMADGEFSKEDRAAVLAMVTAELQAVDVSGTVSDLAKALGLPLSGVIGTVAEWIIDRFAKAHDPGITEVSAKAYPASPLPSTAQAPASAQAAR